MDDVKITFWDFSGKFHFAVRTKDFIYKKISFKGLIFDDNGNLYLTTRIEHESKDNEMILFRLSGLQKLNEKK